MTFLNPAILWGLAAISIPIIIHIFNLKKTKKIEFSTLMFLKEIQQSKYKKIKLKQLLILLCRIAFIILLILMFARPFDTGYLGSAGEKTRSSVLIILDDSFSMQTRGTGGNNLENAKQKINEMLGVLSENDEIFFTTVSKIDRLERNILYKNINQLRDSLQNIKSSDVTKNLSEVLFFANEILKAASHSYREIYIFTDGQKTFVENPNVIASEIEQSEQTKTNLILVGSRAPNNISVDTINVITKIFEKSKPVKVKATVNNHNNFNVSNKNVSLNFGKIKDEKVIDIPANSSVDVEFTFSPVSHGYSSGNIELLQNEISDDEISSDNKQFFAFYTPQKISLLMVSNSGTDLDYIRLAIASSEDLMKDSLGNKSTYFDIKQSAGIQSEDINNFNAVVIVNKPQFSAGESAKIKAFVENGGGVIIYPGSLSGIENYNSTLLKELDLPLISTFFSSENNPSKFDKIDFEHPVFEGIFKRGSNEKNINTESPDVRKGWGLTTGQNSIALITLNNEKNFLVEYSKGKGKLLVFAVSPDMNNSNYPEKNLFSPITVRSILYLANINNIKPAITGNDYFIDLNKLSGVSDSLWISASASSNASTIIISDKNAMLNLNKFTDNTSAYMLRGKNDLIFEFAANFNKIESQPGILDNKEISSYLDEKYNLEANIVKPNETVSASILELRKGKEIWQYFLILALVFLAIEYFLARSITKNK